jgi:hypothetical protein
LVEHEDIRVSFDDESRLLFAHRLCDLREAVEEGALVKDLGLGRVEVFRFRVSQSAGAEPSDPATLIGDGERHALNEALTTAS